MSNTPAFELHSFWRTSATFRVRVALNLKGLQAHEHLEQRLSTEPQTGTGCHGEQITMAHPAFQKADPMRQVGAPA